MHADIHQQSAIARHHGRFPRRWLVAWLAPVLICLIAALHFGSMPPPEAATQLDNQSTFVGARP